MLISLEPEIDMAIVDQIVYLDYIYVISMLYNKQLLLGQFP